MSALGVNRRIPLIVRIDDPWHAAAWRAEQFGGSDTRWAADTVEKYEVTARRLLEDIVAQPVSRILICGTSPLTLALCADYAQRRLEREFFDDRPDRPLPMITLVGGPPTNIGATTSSGCSNSACLRPNTASMRSPNGRRCRPCCS